MDVLALQITHLRPSASDWRIPLYFFPHKFIKRHSSSRTKCPHNDIRFVRETLKVGKNVKRKSVYHRVYDKFPFQGVNWTIRLTTTAKEARACSWI